MPRRTLVHAHSICPRMKRSEKRHKPRNLTRDPRPSAFSRSADLLRFSDTINHESGAAEAHGGSHALQSQQPLPYTALSRSEAVRPGQATSTARGVEGSSASSIHQLRQATAIDRTLPCCSRPYSFASMKQAEYEDSSVVDDFSNGEGWGAASLSSDRELEQHKGDRVSNRDAFMSDWNTDDDGNDDETSRRPENNVLASAVLPFLSNEEQSHLPQGLANSPYHSTTPEQSPAHPLRASMQRFHSSTGAAGIEGIPEDNMDGDILLSRSLTSSPVINDPVRPQGFSPTEHEQPETRISPERREGSGEEDEDLVPVVRMSDPHVPIYGSANLGLDSYLQFWSSLREPHMTGATSMTEFPSLTSIRQQMRAGIAEVGYKNLQGDACDYQGLDWTAMGVSRQSARQRRLEQYVNYVNLPEAATFEPQQGGVGLISIDSYYRFRKMTMRRDVEIAHFQLRHVLATPSRYTALYPVSYGVRQLDVSTGETSMFMDTADIPTYGTCISTLDAKYGVCVGGNFIGDYIIQSLDAADPKAFTRGQITSEPHGIINDVKLFMPRCSATPAAALASNDAMLCIMDVATQTIVSRYLFDAAINCSATSPDGHTRVVVGDYKDGFVIDTVSGAIIQRLSGHRDYCFGCDWSEDGVTVATSSQDMSINVWDVRMWANSWGTGNPLRKIKTELAGARSLRFSPLGSGPKVLVAAEEADYLHVINGETLASEQKFDLFGEIGGIDFAGNGDVLNVLCADEHRGGLLQFDRCGQGFTAQSSAEEWTAEYGEPHHPHTVSWVDQP